MNDKIFVEKVTGKSKKTGKDYQAIKLTIGEWTSLVFPRSQFEAKYIFNILDNQGK